MLMVYRIEHGKTGIGPFRAREGLPKHQLQHLFYKMVDVFHLINSHSGHLPIPFEDVGRCIQSHQKCGCKNLSTLRAWTPTDKKSIRFLHLMGFKIRVYEVNDSDVLIGQYQIVFDCTKAQCVKELSLTKINL